MGAGRVRTGLAALPLLVVAAAGCTAPATAPPRPPATERPQPGPPTEDPVTAPEPVDPPAGVARLQGCEPRSLLPADAAGQCGREVLTGLFNQLVELDPVNAAPRWGSDQDSAVASDLSSLDGRRWVVELEEGWQFHDGTPVTASSFVDAWNFAAYGPNGHASAFLFSPIVGFDELHCPEPGCEPSTDRLTGLRVIDDLTFEIVLEAPDRGLPRRLGHVAFSPLPPVAFEDPEGFAEAPVGNGPFRMEGAWVHDERISLRVVEDHPVAPEGLVGVDVLLYPDLEAAWQAMVEGRLDVATELPPARLPTAREQFRRVVRDGDDIEALVVPSYLPAVADDDRLAVALSRAIDRQAVIDAHLAGQARPARGLVPPAVSDEADRCGRRCRFDPEAARALLAETGLPPGGLELWFDRDGTTEGWVRAIADQWRRHLRLEPGQVRVRSLPHTSWVAHLQDRRIFGLYPVGWSMDVASPGEYLRELHGPGGLFNFDRYGSPEVVEELRRAMTARSERQARLAYRRMEQQILADMHHIPLWTRTHTAFHTERVADVSLDGKGRVRLAALTVEDQPA